MMADFPELYSKRNEPPKPLVYELSAHVRDRLLKTLKAFMGTGSREFEHRLDAIAGRLTKRYGHFAPAHPFDLEHVAIRHFRECDTAKALDFIEAVFTSTFSPWVPRLVDDFNKVFQDEGIGYSLTPMTYVEDDGRSLWSRIRKALLPRKVASYPIIRKRGNTIQDEGMTDCLTLLIDPLYSVANSQFTKAHVHYRHGEWDQAIAYCGSAFESLLKAILTTKGVAFKESATANALITECSKAGIIPQVYENSLIGIANVRNAMSDTTHGRIPRTIVPTETNAEHQLYITAAHMLFIAKHA